MSDPSLTCVVGIDLGSTTTKAVLLDEMGQVVGQGITNSRSNYEVACAVAREEALTSTRFSLLARKLEALHDVSLETKVRQAFQLELFLLQLSALENEILELLQTDPSGLASATNQILKTMKIMATQMFQQEESRKSDFFRDLAGEMFMAEAERLAQEGDVPFDPLVGLFDRAILNVETNLIHRDFGHTLTRALTHLQGVTEDTLKTLNEVIAAVANTPIHEVAFVGTGYGRQTLPFPKAAIRSEILCHGRGAHRIFPNTRTVLDIGGQDTKAIQIDEQGVVSAFQMNDRCAAGCGRYLGYIADELNLGLHELGPLALQAKQMIRINSTCTVFAGAELRERLALGQKREDILAGLHRAILLRAMSLLARSGGVLNEFTFTGGVCKNPMATQLLAGLVQENYGSNITLNTHPDSIYMGALGAALFALDDLRVGRPSLLPSFDITASPKIELDNSCSTCSVEGCPQI